MKALLILESDKKTIQVRKKCTHCVLVFLSHSFCSLVKFDDLLAVSDGSVGVLHVQTYPHGLVHHVEHVDVGVIEDSSHLVQALFTHLQQLTRGCHRVKAAPTQATEMSTDLWSHN